MKQGILKKKDRSENTNVKSKLSYILRFAFQLVLITAIYYVGVGLSGILPICIPGNILGMILLLVLLVSGVIDEKYISSACSFLLKYMAIFFLPAGVAVIESTGLLQGAYLQFGLVCILTTIIVFATTSATVIVISKLIAHKRVCA